MNEYAQPLETERLSLTPLALADAPFLFTLLSCPTHTRYLSVPTARAEIEVRELTEMMLQHPRACLWLVREKGSSEFVGMCGFFGGDAPPNFVYSIHESKAGKGFAFEAATRGIDAGRRALGATEVQLNVHAENAASLRVAAKLGFAKASEYQFPYPQQTQPATVFNLRRSY